ncbi:MAG: hypothetical protein IPL59_25080 [Candidatus Competibacteraceae bacterium]|uniref:hypothetical protein n=1 Tax=Candidatus Contendibacter odensensis TaxID=1400860 RepID=UPI0004B488B9|nr:hypothetical protein [Candidatus Contendobacter odensis]MBK8538074.1 hypothetical protein [Candidatus Competibacteraceae bacterium]
MRWVHQFLLLALVALLAGSAWFYRAQEPGQWRSVDSPLATGDKKLTKIILL